MDYISHVKKSTGSFLTKEMAKRNMSDKELAERMSILSDSDTHVNSIKDWKMGKTMPRADKILIIADIFETSTDEIIGAYSLEGVNYEKFN